MESWIAGLFRDSEGQNVCYEQTAAQAELLLLLGREYFNKCDPNSVFISSVYL